MDSTPPSRLRPKSSSRLPRPSDESPSAADILTPPPPKTTPTHLAILNHSPLQSLLLLSPSSSPTAADPPAAHRRKHKSTTRASSLAAAAAAGILGCSPSTRRRSARRRLEHENRDEAPGPDVEAGRARRSRRQPIRAATKVSAAAMGALPSPDPAMNEIRANEIGELLWEMVMWRDVAKSSLWFGFGCLCFFSSCFTRQHNHYSIISAISHLGLLTLAIAFFRDTFLQRQDNNQRCNYRLKEEDALHLVRVALPVVNAVIEKTGDVFSGEPSMTLKVAPILFFAMKYGHLITLWRILTTVFLISFTVPKFYSCYSPQIHTQAEKLRSCVWEAWVACPHKRIVLASAATIFWNLFSVKTRFYAAFISVVLLRYYRQHRVEESEVNGGCESGGEQEQEQEQEQKAIVVVVEEEQQKQETE
ncbi:Reticulon-like protein B17 [Acorus calamus]|uniref:Reticulon-like protein B17 n=1 Tax=Acorus calamus TaxID=4465 RepID=A0AAV9FHP5_ACOCL|nr:Reticulon-like protein B17 [Acorus calamus]